MHPAEVTPTCKFDMRGHCQYGKQGQACAFAHPPMCYKFLRNATSCCAKGSNCNYSNRATPLMDLNLPAHNHPQTTTASIKPLIQHLATSQHWPSNISHSYQVLAGPQPPSGHPIPQQSLNTTSTQSPAVFRANECSKATKTERHQAQNQLIMTMSQAWPQITPQ